MSSVVEVGAWWVLLAAVWLGTVSSFSGVELWLALGVGLGCALLARAARRAYRGRWRVRLPAGSPAYRLIREALLLCTVPPWRLGSRVRRVSLPDVPSADEASRYLCTELAATSTPASVVVGTGGSAVREHVLHRRA